MAPRTAKRRNQKTQRTRKTPPAKSRKGGRPTEKAVPAAVDRWNGREPPAYYLATERLPLAAHRITVDLETHPPLTPKQRDQLHDLILDYLRVIGRAGGQFRGWERLPGQRKADWCEFLIVRRGQSWEDRRKDYGSFEDEFPELARFC